jgi:hypothetical protein
VHFLDATTQEEAASPLRLILIYSFPTGSPAALHGMHLLGTGDIDLAQIESLVKVGLPFNSQPQILTIVPPPTGRGKVRAGDVHGVERQVEGRRAAPDGESTTQVLRCTMNGNFLFVLQKKIMVLHTHVREASCYRSPGRDRLHSVDASWTLGSPMTPMA